MKIEDAALAVALSRKAVQRAAAALPKPRDGLHGDPGLNGAPGRDGKDGKDGKDGDPGRDGRDGKDGKDGDPGRDGKDGKDGKDGDPGRDGKDGKDGKDGDPGRDGRDGVDGKDGVGVAEILLKDGELSITLTDGRSVKGNVRGPRGKPGIGGIGGPGRDGPSGADGFILAPTIPAFTAATDVDPEAVVTSAAVTVAGDSGTVWPVMVRGDGAPQLEVNADGVWSKERFVRAGDTIRQRHTAAEEPLTETVSVLYYQGGAQPFSVTTVAYVFHPLSLVWRDNVVGFGGTVSDARLFLVSERLYQMDEAGLDADRFDRLWVMAAEGAVQSSVCLISGERFTPTGSPTFTVDRGYTAASSGPKYLRLGYNPAVDAVALQQDSAHIAFYARDESSEGQAFFGSIPGESFSSGFNFFISGGNLFLRLNDDPETGGITTAANGVGFIAANRSGASAREAYGEGVSLGSYGSSPSRALPNVEIALGASNTWATDCEFAFLSIGGSLTAPEHAALASIWSGHLTDIGAAV